VELVLLDESETGDWNATFLSGQYRTKECDLACSDNYVMGEVEDAENFPQRVSQLTKATSVPCSADTVVFPPMYSNKVGRVRLFGPVVLGPDWALISLFFLSVSRCTPRPSSTGAA
jgi:hypothetical protein